MTDLTEKENTVASIFIEWMTEKNGRGSSKYEQLAKSASIAEANKAVIDSLKKFEGKGISTSQIQKQQQKLDKCRKPADGLFILAQASLAGAGLSIKMK